MAARCIRHRKKIAMVALTKIDVVVLRKGNPGDNQGTPSNNPASIPQGNSDFHGGRACPTF
jgi:hypothetical protein